MHMLLYVIRRQSKNSNQGYFEPIINFTHTLHWPKSLWLIRAQLPWFLQSRRWATEFTLYLSHLYFGFQHGALAGLLAVTLAWLSGYLTHWRKIAECQWQTVLKCLQRLFIASKATYLQRCNLVPTAGKQSLIYRSVCNRKVSDNLLFVQIHTW